MVGVVGSNPIAPTKYRRCIDLQTKCPLLVGIFVSVAAKASAARVGVVSEPQAQSFWVELPHLKWMLPICRASVEAQTHGGCEKVHVDALCQLR